MNTFVGTDLQLINALREAAKRQGGTVGALCNAAADALAGIQMTEGLEALAKSGGDVSLQVLLDVINERYRQIAVEGWTPEHDDQHVNGEMAAAASSYALNTVNDFDGPHPRTLADDAWPWADDWWKPDNPRRDLVKAAALILAEIERLDRAQAKGGDA